MLQTNNRILFTGTPETARSFATHLATETKKQVHHVDLSAVISRYIGETEKNLDQLFEQAQQNNWILFFDEADALFGKRTGVKDSHDKYANQEVSYLLQRIRDYKGPVIITTNDKTPIDPDLLKHFRTVLHHPNP